MRRPTITKTIQLPELEPTPNAMLTTTDNPYDPFTEFDTWKSFDDEKGYHTCEYLARIAITSDSLSDADNNSEIDSAIDEIVLLNVLGIYKKVYEQ